MHRARSVLVTALALTILSSVASVAHAQVGWVELDPHLAGSSSVGFLPVSHTFVQGSNGLVETFTDEFTPGTHTLARVDAIAGDCRASADNVTFTVTAGKWTTVDVPMTLKDCNVNINITNPIGGTCAVAAGPMRCLQIVVSPGGQVRMCDPMFTFPDPQGC